MYITQNVILKNLEIIPIKPYKSICIGDPMYLENIKAGRGSAGEKSHVFNEKMRCCKHGMIMFATTSEKYEINKTSEFDTVYAAIALSGREDITASLNQIKTYLTNKYFKNTVKVRKDLGCDTASFEITVDESRYEAFHTGADGYYGYAAKYKEYYGSCIELSLDGDLFSQKEVKEKMLSLFREDKVAATDSEISNHYFTKEHIEWMKKYVIDDFIKNGGKCKI